MRLVKTTPKDGLDEHRRALILRELRRTCRKCKPNLVVIEEYAFSRHSRSRSQLAELGGCVKQYLHTHDVLFTSMSSMTIKKFATGNGRAEKAEMVAAAQAIDPRIVDDNVADALHLARWGFENFGNLVEES